MSIFTEEKLEYTFLPVPVLRKTIAVKAGHDAHICLTSGPSDDLPITEIMIGGWNNSKSIIRLNKEKPEKAEADTPEVLTAEEFRTFIIEWSPVGEVQVYLEQATEPFLSWRNPDPYPITNFGIRTSWGATGNWLIDGQHEAETEDSMEYLFNEIAPISGRLDFEVKAKSNAHISLTSGPSEDLPMHEIFLGGWDNSKSAIRHNKEKPDMVFIETPGIVTDEHFKAFWIEWNHATVTVGNGGSKVPFMTWEGRIPHVVTHFGIRTFYGATGEWVLSGGGGGEVPADAVAPSPSAPAYDGGLSIQTGEAVLREKRDEPNVEIISWVPAELGGLPEGALVSGSDAGVTLFIARAGHEGDLIPGKLLPEHGVAYVPWGGAEIAKEQYEVLVASPDSVSWVSSTGGSIPDNAIPGGNSADGETLFIGRVNHLDTVTNGKVQPSHGTCYVSYGGEELGFPEYEVLVKN